jgi:transposase
VAQGALAAIVNPKRVRDFARGMGLEAKTDRVDAKVIAHYGEVRRPAPTPVPERARAELGEILACRRQLIDEITVRQQQLEHLRSPCARERITKALTFMRQEAKELAKLLRQQIQADATLAADFALLTSMPGCGPILAATLLAEMPELGRLDRRKVAALAGLAPVAKDSGLREHRRVIKGGRGQVRRALYMAAVASLRIKASPCKARYDQLIAKGKAPKLVLTALMRKMLVTLNAMLKAKQTWKDGRESGHA